MMAGERVNISASQSHVEYAAKTSMYVFTKPDGPRGFSYNGVNITEIILLLTEP